MFTMRIAAVTVCAVLAAPLVEGFTGGGGWKGAVLASEKALPTPQVMEAVSFDVEDYSTVVESLEEEFTPQVDILETSSSDIVIPLYNQEQRKALASSWLQQPSPLVGRMICLTAAAIYGTNFSIVKMLDDVMPLEVSATLRFGLAAFVVSAIVLFQEQVTKKPLYNDFSVVPNKAVKERLPAMMLGLEVGAWYAVGYLCQAQGLHSVDASKSAFFNALAVVVVPLISAMFEKTKLGFREIGSIAMAIGGVGMLQLAPSAGANIGLINFSAGDVFCLAQALFFGVGYWRLEKAAVKFPSQAGRITVGQLVGVAGGSALYCAMTTGLPSLDTVQHLVSDPFTTQALIWTGLISTALALYLETVALKAISATELTILMTSVSLWGTAFAVVYMDERLAPISMVGGGMILMGCVLSALKPQEEPGPVFSELDSV